MSELAKTYDASKVEDKWYSRWLEQKAFHTDAEQEGEPYCIVIPPPNVTGILHMGHALNVTIQDILIRWRRMQGRNALWVPGTDHAGIATQNVVERMLREEGKTREDLGRADFVQKVWEWRKKYGNTIISQLKKLGVSCDWDRERFTMDEGLSEAVAEVFIRLYNKQLIYRGNYIINWCPRCQTALSDEESEHVESQGQLYYIRYPCEGGKKKDAAIVATTRPETLLGDVAVAVNPRDERYSRLAGRKLLLPILKRTLDIIQDDYVDPEFGTGIVKVTPAHDPNDFEMGQRHGLTPVNVMNDDGTMNENAGPYKGMDRFDCRKQIVDDLTKARLIEKIEDHTLSIGRCYRCNTVIEPRLSLQWFVKMKPLARPAIEVVKEGRIQFVPERWTKVYLDWMENIRDWCISRQIWWGHRIPVFYCDACKHEWAVKGEPTQCPACRSNNIRQDEDVLDTWFSSWLWPFSTLGWPHENKDMACYYPTNSLVTASEIIFFWVARMIIAGMDLMGDIPFRKVYIHGTVRDASGQKMSKSLGNSIDPLAVIKKYSADALRFSLMMVTAVGQNVYLSDEKFEIGRNFLTKIWNAARFMQMYSKDVSAFAAQADPAKKVQVDIENPSVNPDMLSPDDKHIVSRLHKTIAFCTDNLERFRFNDVAKDLHDFVWHQYCDWYIEYAKIVLSSNDAARKEQVVRVMRYVFSNALRLLHPFIPFITEELWHGLGYGTGDDTILFAQWPEAMDSSELSAAWNVNERLVSYVENKHDLIRIGRTLRTDYGIAPSKKIHYVIKPENKTIANLLEQDQLSISVLLKAESLVVDLDYTPDKVLPNGVSKLGTIFMPITGLIDIEVEIKKLTEQLNKTTSDLAGVNRKLENIAFVQKAPQPVVELQKTRKQEFLDKCEKLRRLIAVLSNADEKNI